MEKAHVVSSVRDGSGRVFAMVEVPKPLHGSGKKGPAGQDSDTEPEDAAMGFTQLIDERKYYKHSPQSGVPAVEHPVAIVQIGPVEHPLIIGPPPKELLAKKLKETNGRADLFWRLGHPGADAPHDPSQKTFEIWSNDERYAYCIVSTPPNTHTWGYQAVIDFHEAHPAGLGTGKFLYETLVEPYVRFLGYKKISLSPKEDAVGFWRKMGFNRIAGGDMVKNISGGGGGGGGGGGSAKMEGEGHGSDDVPKSAAGYAYSDLDIHRALGAKIPIHRYPDLLRMSSPDALFKNQNATVLLFLTEGKDNGHWIAVLDHGTHYEVFDSFGTEIDGDRAWLDKEKLLEFNETLPLLSNLLARGNKPIDHNSTKLQSDHADTCGRWVVWRIRNSNKPLKAFVAEMKGSGKGTPDQLVVDYTYGILNK